MADILTGYIGTYTEGAGGKARGIYHFTMNAAGVMLDLHLAAEMANPSYLALAPSGKVLYAVNETAKHRGKGGTGAVSAFALDNRGGLAFLNDKASQGSHPCHIVINRDATHAVVANYTVGVLSVFPLDKRGFLGDPVQVIRFEGKGPDTERQDRSHAHSFMFDKDYRFGFACDLGSDRVMAYRFDKDAARPLVPAVPPFYKTKPGAGPRHGIFFPSGTVAYYLNELSSTVDVLGYDLEGRFKRMQSISALPKERKPKRKAPGAADTGVPNTAAAIRLSGDGKFLYTSNRGHDSIAVFKIKKSGVLEFSGALPSGGKHPRDFIIDPEGNFLIAVNKDSDNLAVFRINRRTGLFVKEREYPIPSPVCVIFRS